jgi:hypothetical protein
MVALFLKGMTGALAPFTYLVFYAKSICDYFIADEGSSNTSRLPHLCLLHVRSLSFG